MFHHLCRIFDTLDIDIIIHTAIEIALTATCFVSSFFLKPLNTVPNAPLPSFVLTMMYLSIYLVDHSSAISLYIYYISLFLTFIHFLYNKTSGF